MVQHQHVLAKPRLSRMCSCVSAFSLKKVTGVHPPCLGGVEQKMLIDCILQTCVFPKSLEGHVTSKAPASMLVGFLSMTRTLTKCQWQPNVVSSWHEFGRLPASRKPAKAHRQRHWPQIQPPVTDRCQFGPGPGGQDPFKATPMSPIRDPIYTTAILLPILFWRAWCFHHLVYQQLNYCMCTNVSPLVVGKPDAGWLQSPLNHPFVGFGRSSLGCPTLP